jgi:hypothetical protein
VEHLDDDAGTRAPLAVAAAVLAGAATAVMLSYLARLFLWLEWLGASPVRESIVAAAALGGFAIGGRFAPYSQRLAWMPVVFLLVPATVFVVGMGDTFAHVQLGTPVRDCHGDLDHVETCRGRDWSAGQGRRVVRRAVGRLRSDTCRAFTRDVGSFHTQPSLTGSTARASPCALSQPQQWTELPCSDVHLVGYVRCFTCGGGSMASDIYRSVLAVDSQCAHASLTRTVNMNAETAAWCLEDTTRTDVCFETPPLRAP